MASYASRWASSGLTGSRPLPAIRAAVSSGGIPAAMAPSIAALRAASWLRSETRISSYTTIRESISDPAIGNIVYHAICESGEGLIRQFSFDPAAHHAYIDRTFRRYQNPYLEDENIRVGREPIRKLDPADRLIKPLLTAYSYGLPVDHLLFGAAAALRFDCPKDAQSVELQAKIRTDGAESALALYTGLTPDHPLFGRILDIYRALAVAAKA